MSDERRRERAEELRLSFSPFFDLFHVDSLVFGSLAFEMLYPCVEY